MNLEFYREKLEASPEFGAFQKNYPEMFFCSAFFAIDFEGEDNKQHLDFYVVSENKIYSFQMEAGMQCAPIELPEGAPAPTGILENPSMDFKELEKMIGDKIQSEGSKKKIQKILIALQNVKGKNMWVCTVFVSGLGLVKVLIDDAEKRITAFENKSLFDMVNVFKKKDSSQ